MTRGRIELTEDGRIARVVIRQAGKFNAMSRAMWRELRQVFERIQASTDIRCALLCGADGHFCAGGDISEYPSFRFDPLALRDFHENDVWGGLRAMLECDVPIVAQIQGNCMGAGIEMACCCDMRIAGESARFGAPIAHLGFPMAPREAQLVARELGVSVAREMLLAAAVLDAPGLLARGFLNRVVPDDRVVAEAEGLAQRMAELSPQAARLNKQTLRKAVTWGDFAPLGQGDGGAQSAAWSSAYAYADSAEHREGIHAFIAKRKPIY